MWLTAPQARPERHIRRREIAVALVVLTPLWTLGVALRDELTVLWVSVAAAIAFGLAAVVLQARHHVPPRIGHDVWWALPAAAAHLVVSYIAIPVAEAIVPLIGRQAEDIVVGAKGDLPTLLVAAISAFAIAPLEELFWRGAVQPSLGVGRSPAVGHRGHHRRVHGLPPADAAAAPDLGGVPRRPGLGLAAGTHRGDRGTDHRSCDLDGGDGAGPAHVAGRGQAWSGSEVVNPNAAALWTTLVSWDTATAG